MNLQQSPTINIERPGPANASSARLQGRWLLLARLAWIALVLFMMGVAIASLPASFAALHHPCTASNLLCGGNGLLTASDIQALPKHGLSLDTYAWSSIGITVLTALIYIVLGGIIFWLKSDDWMALLVALMFISVGAVDATSDLQFSSSIWMVLQNGVLLIESLAILYTLALFPNGRFVPRWAGWVALVYPAYTVCYLVILLQLHIPGWLLFNNPINAFAWFGSWIVLTLAQLYRYFRVSTPVERQQTKWVAFSFFVVLVGSFVGILISPTLLSFQYNGLLYILISNGASILVLLWPFSIALAILRYRLWDIDIIINRTLVYSTLTLSLALVYIGLIIGLQTLLGGIIKQNNDVVIVISTLAIAALFQPLRHRLQQIIDRRFYRRKYDAARTLEAFSTTLRNEVDLATLSENLVAVVQETMQPAHVSLWLRSSEHQGNHQVPWRVNPPVPSEDKESQPHQRS